MQFTIFFASFVGLALAAPRPQHESALAEIINFENDNNGLGTYFYHYKTSDGQEKEEHGEITDEGTENEALKVNGSYSYTDPDGKYYFVQYTAGKNGFVPSTNLLEYADAEPKKGTDYGDLDFPSAALASLAGRK